MPLLSALVVLFTACTGVPEGIEPVKNFEADRYLGKWYEIARLDHSFEEGLSRVTAEYSRRDDGGLEVINRGYDVEEEEWSVAEGKAFFTRTPDVGALKVSFFGPFYSAYNIFALDREGYKWALVCGYNRDYFWILAREPLLQQSTLERLLKVVEEKGFATDDLIFVDHSPDT